MKEQDFSNLLVKITNKDSTLTTPLVVYCLSLEQLGHLLDVLQTNDRITQLNLAHGTFKDEGAKLLAERLPSLPHITWLDLGNCGITSQGAIILAELTTLQFLSLTQNPIQDEGVIALAKKDCLSTLYVANCGFGDAAAAVLCESKNITLLIHVGNKYSYQWSEKLNQMFASNLNRKTRFPLKEVEANPQPYLAQHLKTLNNLISIIAKEDALAKIIIPYLLKNKAQFDFYVKTKADLNHFMAAFPTYGKEAFDLFFPERSLEATGNLKITDLVLYNKYRPDLIQPLVDRHIGTDEGFRALIPDRSAFVQLADHFPTSAERLLTTMADRKEYFLQVVHTLDDVVPLMQRFPDHKPMFTENLRRNLEQLLTKPIPNLQRLIQILRGKESLEALVIPLLLADWTLFCFYVQSNKLLLDFLGAFPKYAEQILNLLADQDPLANGPLTGTASCLCHLNKFSPNLLSEWVAKIFAHDDAFFRLFTDLTSFTLFSQTFPATAATFQNRVCTEENYFFHLVRCLDDLQCFVKAYPTAAQSALGLFFAEHRTEVMVNLTVHDLDFYKPYYPDLIQSVADRIIGTDEGFCALLPDRSAFLQLANNFPTSAERLLATMADRNEYFLQVVHSLDDIVPLMQRFPNHKPMFTKNLRRNQEHLLTNPIPNLQRLNEIIHGKDALEALVIPLLLADWTLFCFYIQSNKLLLGFLEAFPKHAEQTLKQVSDHLPNATGPLVETANDLFCFSKFAPDLIRKWVRNILWNEEAVFRLFPNLTQLIEFTRIFPETTVALLSRILEDSGCFFHLIRSLKDFNQLIEAYPVYHLECLAMLKNHPEESLGIISDLDALQTYLCLFPGLGVECHSLLLEFIITKQPVFVQIAPTFPHLLEFLNICQGTQKGYLVKGALARIFRDFSQYNGLLSTPDELTQLIAAFPACTDIIFAGLLSDQAIWKHLKLDGNTLIANLFPDHAAYKTLRLSLQEVRDHVRQLARVVKEQQILRQKTQQPGFFSRVPNELWIQIVVHCFGPKYSAIQREVLFGLIARFLELDERDLGCEPPEILLEGALKEDDKQRTLAITQTAILAYGRYRNTRISDEQVLGLFDPTVRKYTLDRIKAKLTAFVNAVLRQRPPSEMNYGYLDQPLRQAIIARFGDLDSIADERQVEAAIMVGFQDYLDETGLQREAFTNIPAKTAAWIAKGLGLPIEPDLASQAKRARLMDYLNDRSPLEPVGYFPHQGG